MPEACSRCLLRQGKIKQTQRDTRSDPKGEGGEGEGSREANTPVSVTTKGKTSSKMET